MTISAHIQTSDSAPLVIKVERDPVTQVWQSKTILTGMVVTTPNEDAHVESVYTNVKFTAGSGCVPESGTVAGQIFHGTGTTPVRSYQIDFAAGDGLITYDDGTTAPYVPEYCSLEVK